jgi:hypothetical protein
VSKVSRPAQDTRLRRAIGPKVCAVFIIGDVL